MTVTQIIAAARAAYGLWKDLKGGGGDTAAQTAQILNAIADAKSAIMSQADQLAAADARACTTHAVLEAKDAQFLQPNPLQTWAQQVTGCATLIDSLLNTVTDKPTLNRLGFALSAVGPVALAARTRAGLSTDGLLALLITSTRTSQTKTAPVCTTTTTGNNIFGFVTTWSCVGANGDTAGDSKKWFRSNPLPPIDYSPYIERAGMNTTWKLAGEVLPVLQA